MTHRADEWGDGDPRAPWDRVCKRTGRPLPLPLPAPMSEHPPEVVERVADIIRRAVSERAGPFNSALARAVARAVLDALSARPTSDGWRVPEGWRLVPEEPTPEMRKAYHEMHALYERGYGEAPDVQWTAMLDAAPVPPPPGSSAAGEG